MPRRFTFAFESLGIKSASDLTKFSDDIIEASTGLKYDTTSGNMVFDVSGASTKTHDAHLSNSNLSFSVDENNNDLHIKAKYSDGTVKSATVSLT